MFYAYLKPLVFKWNAAPSDVNNIIRDQRCCHQAKGLFYSELRFDSVARRIFVMHFTDYFQTSGNCAFYPKDSGMR